MRIGSTGQNAVGFMAGKIQIDAQSILRNLQEEYRRTDKLFVCFMERSKYLIWKSN